MSDASHCRAMSEKLKRDREMCLDSLVSLTIPRDIIPLQTVRSEGSCVRTDIYIEQHQWFGATGHFFYTNTRHWLL